MSNATLTDQPRKISRTLTIFMVALYFLMSSLKEHLGPAKSPSLTSKPSYYFPVIPVQQRLRFFILITELQKYCLILICQVKTNTFFIDLNEQLSNILIPKSQLAWSTNELSEERQMRFRMLLVDVLQSRKEQLVTSTQHFRQKD